MAEGLVIRGLVKEFGSNRVVNELDLTVPEGQVVALLGPSGCGKTTTLRCIAGLEQPTSGEISIGGKVVYSSAQRTVVSSERRGVGLVFQSYALWPHLTVAQNVAYGLKVLKRPKDEIASRVDVILESVGLTGFGDRHPGTLSGGQQQRVALARSLVTEPRVLLFDEPLSNLDAKLREAMRHELREVIKRIGLTAVYVTHDQIEAMSITDNVVLLNNGSIEQEGPPREIYGRPRTKFAAEFIGSANTVPGRIVSRDGDTAEVELVPGVRLTTSRTDVPEAAADEVVVAIRPEQIELGVAAGPNAFEVSVLSAEFLGSQTVYHLGVGGLVLRAQSPNSDHAEGATLRVRIAPKDLHLVRDSAPPKH